MFSCETFAELNKSVFYIFELWLFKIRITNIWNAFSENIIHVQLKEERNLFLLKLYTLNIKTTFCILTRLSFQFSVLLCFVLL